MEKDRTFLEGLQQDRGRVKEELCPIERRINIVQGSREVKKEENRGESLGSGRDEVIGDEGEEGT